MTKIGVYGTLKKGEANHHILKNCEYLGDRILQNVAITDRSGFPFAFKKKGYRTRVEVYKVNQSTLETIDYLEGHPDWYKREKIDGIWVYLNERSAKGFKLLQGDGVWHS